MSVGGQSIKNNSCQRQYRETNQFTMQNAHKKVSWVPTATILKEKSPMGGTSELTGKKGINRTEGEIEENEKPREEKKKRNSQEENWTCSNPLQLHVKIVQGLQIASKGLVISLTTLEICSLSTIQDTFCLYREIHTKVFFPGMGYSKFCSQVHKEDQSMLRVGKVLNRFI